jgi:hypothetical protein
MISKCLAWYQKAEQEVGTIPEPPGVLLLGLQLSLSIVQDGAQQMAHSTQAVGLRYYTQEDLTR